MQILVNDMWLKCENMTAYANSYDCQTLLGSYKFKIIRNKTKLVADTS